MSERTETETIYTITADQFASGFRYRPILERRLIGEQQVFVDLNRSVSEPYFHARRKWQEITGYVTRQKDGVLLSVAFRYDLTQPDKKMHWRDPVESPYHVNHLSLVTEIETEVIDLKELC